METKTFTVNELPVHLIDYYVAKSLNKPNVRLAKMRENNGNEHISCWIGHDKFRGQYMPSGDWDEAGEFFHYHKFYFYPGVTDDKGNVSWIGKKLGSDLTAHGDYPLEAVMRCYLMHHYGPTCNYLDVEAPAIFENKLLQR